MYKISDIYYTGFEALGIWSNRSNKLRLFTLCPDSQGFQDTEINETIFI